MGNRIDLVITNLPTDPRSEDPRPKDDDPRWTLVGEGAEGLGLVRKLAVQARRFLRPGGRMIVMVPNWQVDILLEGLGELGYASSRVTTSVVEPFRFVEVIRR